MVIRLTKILYDRPREIHDATHQVRVFRGPEDIPLWLELRNRAFREQTAEGRPWTESDFRREFLAKPWWRPEWMWFAEAAHPPSDSPVAVGTIALGRAERSGSRIPSVQWLAVLPEHRRHGAARRLLARLETAAWDAGHRRVLAETLATWEAAMRFYESQGYEPMNRIRMSEAPAPEKE